MKITRLILTGLVLAFGVVQFTISPKNVLAATGTATIVTDRNSWVDPHSPDTAYGADTLPILGYGTANTFGDGSREALLHFDISSIPANATNITATLKLHLELCTQAALANIAIVQIASNWTETGVTWNNKPTTTGSQVGAAFTCAAGGDVQFSATTFVNNWFGGQANYGVMTVDPSFTPEWLVQFTSRIGSTTSQRPTLTVSYTTPDETTDTASTGSTTTTTTTTNSTSASTAKKTVDTAIAVPTLEYVTVGETRTPVPISGELPITIGDVVKIGGKSFASATVALTIGDKVYSGAADAAGVWELTVDTKDIIAGNYTVKAQAQDTKKNKGSEEVVLFSMKVAAAIAEVVAPVATEPTPALVLFWQHATGQYRWLTIGILTALVLGLGGLLYYLKRRKPALKI